MPSRPVHCAACHAEIPRLATCPHCGGDPVLRHLEAGWLLEREIGAGRSGATWKAWPLAGGEPVAVKEIPLRRLSAKDLELVQREAAVLSRLDHPGIPAFVEAFVHTGTWGRRLVLVQEHIEGHTLEAECAIRQYDVREVLEAMAGILEVLAYLHGLAPPVIHRDVKPANVIRREGSGHLVLVDYGAVRDVVAGTLGGSTVAGTFGYMAPEQFWGEATPATDLWATGALAVRLLSRKEPHTMRGWDARTLDWRPHVSVPPEVELLLWRLLEPEPERRLGDTAAALAETRRLARVTSTLQGVVSGIGGRLGVVLEARRQRERNRAHTSGHGATHEVLRAAAERERQARQGRVEQAIEAARAEALAAAWEAWAAVLRHIGWSGREEVLDLVRAFVEDYSGVMVLTEGEEHPLHLPVVEEARNLEAALRQTSTVDDLPTDPKPGERAVLRLLHLRVEEVEEALPSPASTGEPSAEFRLHRRLRAEPGRRFDLALRWCPPGTLVRLLPHPPGAPRTYAVHPQAGFWIGETPVTQAFWASWRQGDPPTPAGLDQPPDQVFWSECTVLSTTLDWAGGHPAPGDADAHDLRVPPMRFHLPSTAQLEWALGARASRGFAVEQWGNQQRGGAAGVANAWGIRTLPGCPWEWCLDQGDDPWIEGSLRQAERWPKPFTSHPGPLTQAPLASPMALAASGGGGAVVMATGCSAPPRESSWRDDVTAPLSSRWRQALERSLSPLSQAIFRQHYGEGRPLEQLERALQVDRLALDVSRAGLREVVRRAAADDGIPLEHWPNEHLDFLLSRLAAFSSVPCPALADIIDGRRREHVAECTLIQREAATRREFEASHGGGDPPTPCEPRRRRVLVAARMDGRSGRLFVLHSALEPEARSPQVGFRVVISTAPPSKPLGVNRARPST